MNERVLAELCRSGLIASYAGEFSQATAFSDAIKCDHYETPFRSVALERRDFAATNKVSTVKGSQCARYRRPIFLECGWVINFKFRDDITGRDFSLLRADSAAAGNANCDASREDKPNL
jgi:hypothetical protein